MSPFVIILLILLTCVVVLIVGALLYEEFQYSFVRGCFWVLVLAISIVGIILLINTLSDVTSSISAFITNFSTELSRSPLPQLCLVLLICLGLIFVFVWKQHRTNEPSVKTRLLRSTETHGTNKAKLGDDGELLEPIETQSLQFVGKGSPTTTEVVNLERGSYQIVYRFAKGTTGDLWLFDVHNGKKTKILNQEKGQGSMIYYLQHSGRYAFEIKAEGNRLNWSLNFTRLD